jgi:radical SAM superfamily enzyme YgiQ (UPF0313 family)
MPTRSPLRVALVYPPSRTQLHRTPPLGLLMLGAVLTRAGHLVRLVDANALHRPLDPGEVAGEVAAFGAEVVGVTLLTPLAREAYEVAGLLRADGARLLAGGPHATLRPDEPVLRGFDATLRGEGEPGVVAAVEALAGRRPPEEVPGFTWRGPDGMLHSTAAAPPPEDLDALPWPALELADPAHYASVADGVLVHGSRGCPASCAFCAGGLFGRRLRTRSVEGVMAELSDRHHRLGARHFVFVDDSMGLDRARLLRLCARLAGAALPITWEMTTGIETMDDETLAAAAAAGCTRIVYGVESGNPETLRRIQKPHSVELVLRVIPATARAGIRPVISFVLGFPWEDRAALQETLALLRALTPWVEPPRPDLAPLLVPFPGTALYDAWKDRFGFGGWWLGAPRAGGVPAPGRTRAARPYFERVLHGDGATLDADFFRYPAEVRRTVFELLRVVFRLGLRAEPLGRRLGRRLLFDLSVGLAGRWPRLERRLLGALARPRDRARALAATQQGPHGAHAVHRTA